jgi:hypothetical protein
MLTGAGLCTRARFHASAASSMLLVGACEGRTAQYIKMIQKNTAHLM